MLIGDGSAAQAARFTSVTAARVGASFSISSIPATIILVVGITALARNSIRVLVGLLAILGSALTNSVHSPSRCYFAGAGA